MPSMNYAISPTVAFGTAMMVNFVDQMGSMFTSPVIVPYGKSLGADLQTIALFSTVRGIAAIVSNLWLSMLSDSCGQRVAIVTSVFGCTIGYATQAYTGLLMDSNASLAITLFMVGRGISGFFCGATPVLRSYVSQISAWDQSVMTQRMVNLMVAGQALGIALSPISGALASFSLVLPFAISAACGVLGTVWCVFLFPNAQQVKDLGRGPDAQIEDVASASTATKPKVQAGTASEKLPGEYDNHPAFDLVNASLTLAFCALMVFVQGGMLMMPLMFAWESFGLQVPDDFEATQGNIAKAVGLASIPRGVCSILVSVLLFVPVTRRCGQVPTMVASTLALTVAVLIFGFFGTKVWHTIPYMIVGGCSSGFLMPSLSPLGARYATAHYPKKQAIAQAMPVMGMNLSNAFAQNILAAIISSFDDERQGVQAAYCAVAAAMIVFLACYVIAYTLVEKRSVQKQESQDERRVSMGLDAEKEKLKEFLEYKDPDAFFEEMVTDMREQWKTQKESLWHGSAQMVYKRRVLAAVPKLPEWQAGGSEHLEELNAILKPFPEESAMFQELFPGLNHGRIPALAGEPGLMGAGMTTYMGPRKTAQGRRSRAATADMAASLQPLVREEGRA